MPKLRKTGSLHINDARIAGLYDLEHTIGKGHFAVVKLARHVFTGEMVAVKVIDKTRLDPISTAHMMQEVRCMKLVQHPNIVRLYEVIDTQTKLFLILELGDYDMYEWVMKRGYDKAGCNETDAQLYFSQIIQAINYCHKLHVVHRDLKPENVVFFEKLGMVKLTDFGFSNLFTPGQQLQTSCGSLAYSAPEILLGDAYDAPAVDVWSLGVILYMLVCGRLPFQESNDSETLTRILDCKFSFPEHLSQECRKLISSMLVREPASRATLNEIVLNKWVRAGDRGHAEALPLIVKEHLPACAHTTIVQQMVAGEIGSEEEVLTAIERNEYNHLTATYYLLAERVLSCYRQAEASRLMQAAARELSIDENSDPGQAGTTASSSTSTAAGPAGSSGTRSRSRSNSWRGPAPRRAYSILKEESEEELCSYLRSSSRQSSRFFSATPAGPKLVSSASSSARGEPLGGGVSSRASGLLLGMSRANSNDSFAPGSSAILEDDVEGLEAAAWEQEQLLERQERPASGTFGEKPRASSLSMASAPSQAAPLELAPPSATSTPFLQRLLLAPIRENQRDQSPDIGQLDLDSPPPAGCGSSSSVFQFDSLLQEEAGAPKSRMPGGRAVQTQSAGQLPPLPASPDKPRLASGAGCPHRPPFLPVRPLRNAASLELFPSSAQPHSLNGSSRCLNGRGEQGGQMQAATSPPTPNPANCACWAAHPQQPMGMGLERHPNFVNLSALPSSSSLASGVRRRKSSSSSLSRRNSSPSVSSAFRAAASHSLHSSRDRISPQAIQELLELSRLSGRMRRTASPDSRLSSSRSPSPSCLSSGRVSPAVLLSSSAMATGSSSGGMGRMKVANSGGGGGLCSFAFLPATGGGMRKLSSSPHLLGICEEMEEAEFGAATDGGQSDNGGRGPEKPTGGRFARGGLLFCSNNGSNCSNPSSSHAAHSHSAATVLTRSGRSASTGLPSMGRLSIGGTANGTKKMAPVPPAPQQQQQQATAAKIN